MLKAIKKIEKLRCHRPYRFFVAWGLIVLWLSACIVNAIGRYTNQTLLDDVGYVTLAYCGLSILRSFFINEEEEIPTILLPVLLANKIVTKREKKVLFRLSLVGTLCMAFMSIIDALIIIRNSMSEMSGLSEFVAMVILICLHAIALFIIYFTLLYAAVTLYILVRSFVSYSGRMRRICLGLILCPLIWYVFVLRGQASEVIINISVVAILGFLLYELFRLMQYKDAESLG